MLKMASQSLRQNSLESPCEPIRFMLRREMGSINQNSQPDKLMRDRTGLAKNLYRKEFKAHFGCVNAIEFSHKGGEFMSSGGDDRRVLLWNVEKALSDIGSPRSMKGEHNSNIFCIAFDHDNKKIFSGGNDEQVIVHDIESGTTLDVFKHDDAVYGLTSDPYNVNIFASACDDGRILVFDIREPPSTDPFCLANYTSSMHAVAYNPMEPRLLATANAREGIGLWDIRKPRSCLLRYGSGLVQQSCMSVCISKMGDRLLALRRRLPAVLYDIKSAYPLCEFDNAGYYNSCTMKSCSFAGERDQYVLSGSDDFNLYMWKIPDDLSERKFVEEAHMVLHGHRSIVNQVRFNAANHLIISSGVEKSIKVWSPFPVPKSEGGIDSESVKKNSDRHVYSHEEYINLMLHTGNVMTHDYSNESVEEDPRMLAFFDSLVQRELEGFSSSEDLDTSEEEILERIQNLTGSDLSESEGSPLLNNAESDEVTFNPFTVAFASAVSSNATTSNEAQHYSEISDSSDSDSSTTETDNYSNPEACSIQQLIKQKRKKIKKNGKNKRKRPLVVYTSHSSDSENEASNSKVISTVSNGQSDGHPFNILSASRQRQNLQLKRIKLLRKSALNSDSEQSNDENAFLDGTNSKEGACVDTNSKIEENHKCKNNDAKDMGPYLHGAEELPSCSKTGTSKTVSNSVNPDNPESPEENEVENHRDNWTEFKRIKNHVKSRRYRSHSKSEED